MRSEGGASVCEATVKVRVGEQRAHTVADGDGPVNALDAALRAALATFYPQLHDVRLTDYKVRIIDSTTGTAATTRVLIQSSDGATEWGTIGVNENIVEASLQALVDSLECALIQSRPPARAQVNADPDRAGRDRLARRLVTAHGKPGALTCSTCSTSCPDTMSASACSTVRAAPRASSRLAPDAVTPAVRARDRDPAAAARSISCWPCPDRK